MNEITISRTDQGALHMNRTKSLRIENIAYCPVDMENRLNCVLYDLSLYRTASFMIFHSTASVGHMTLNTL